MSTRRAQPSAPGSTVNVSVCVCLGAFACCWGSVFPVKLTRELQRVSSPAHQAQFANRSELTWLLLLLLLPLSLPSTEHTHSGTGTCTSSSDRAPPSCEHNYISFRTYRFNFLNFKLVSLALASARNFLCCRSRQLHTLLPQLLLVNWW